MKPPSDPFSALLQTWKTRPAPDPAFAAGVWDRVRSGRPTTRPASLLPFPIALPLAASLAVMIGVGAALSVNQHQTTDAMAAAYARTIDPLQMAMSSPAPSFP